MTNILDIETLDTERLWSAILGHWEASILRNITYSGYEGLNCIVMRVISEMPENQKIVLRCRFGRSKLTLRETGEKHLNTSPERARQLEQKLLRRFRADPFVLRYILATEEFRQMFRNALKKVPGNVEYP